MDQYVQFWCYYMNNTTTVSAKVPEDLKKKAKKLDINISKVTRKSLQEKVEEEEKKRLKKKAKKAGKILKEIPTRDIADRIRETRKNS